jgi:hypothetical protein
VRGWDLSASLKAKFAVAKIIRDDKHNVRFLGTNHEHGGREARHQSEHLNHESSYALFHFISPLPEVSAALALELSLYPSVKKLRKIIMNANAC